MLNRPRSAADACILSFKKAPPSTSTRPIGVVRPCVDVLVIALSLVETEPHLPPVPQFIDAHNVVKVLILRAACYSSPSQQYQNGSIFCGSELQRFREERSFHMIKYKNQNFGVEEE